MNKIENFCDVPIGNDAVIECLVVKQENKTASNGKKYQSIYVRDKVGDNVLITNFNQTVQFGELPVVAKITVNADTFQGTKSFKMILCRVTPDADASVYINSSVLNSEQARNELIAYIKSIKNRSLCRVVCRIINKELENYNLPLSGKLFTRGLGIYEATLNLCKIASSIAYMYGMNSDLAIAASTIYYIGHCKTINILGVENADNYLLTPELIGYEILNKAVYELENDEDEEVRKDMEDTSIHLLKHVIASSTKVTNPAIPEAIMLKQISNLINEIERYYSSTRSAQPNSFVEASSYTSPKFFVPNVSSEVIDSDDTTEKTQVSQTPKSPAPVSGEEGKNGNKSK